MNAPSTLTQSLPVAAAAWHTQVLSWSQRACKRSLPLLFLSCLCIGLLFPRLGERDLWSSHEGRAAQDAQSLLLDRAWGLPRLFCLQADLQKPPLYYWLVAGVAWAQGGNVDAWSVRFPAAASGVACVWLLYAFGCWMGRPRSGLIGAFLLATSMHFTWLAHIGRIDMPLTLAVAVCVCFFWKGVQVWREQGAWAGAPWFVVVYLSLAAALLLKGPIGAVLPIAVILAHLSVERLVDRPAHTASLREFARGIGLYWGVVLVLVAVMPWYLWVNHQTHGEFFRVFFWKHNVERGLGGGSLHAHPWWFYIPRLAFDFLPWSPLLIPASWWLFRHAWKSDPLARFGWIWLMVIGFVLSCSSFKRADYLLPAFPGAAFLLGCVIDRLLQLRPQAIRYALAAAAVCSCALLGGWYYYLSVQLPASEPEREFRTFAQLIRKIAPAPQPIIFFRTESHALAFHVGRPVDSILEWENVDTWAGRAGTYYVVMPADLVDLWPEHVHAGSLKEIARNDPANGRPHEQPLVLLQTCQVGPPH
jgi:4-amino-4-deoxy-L-arabinose transferase-like glycosyltransferase